jgi:chorismate mutase
MDDTPGLLSKVLSNVAKFHANILTIHQTIPVNKIAMLTLSIEILPQTESISVMLQSIEEMEGIHYVKILARE